MAHFSSRVHSRTDCVQADRRRRIHSKKNIYSKQIEDATANDLCLCESNGHWISRELNCSHLWGRESKAMCVTVGLNVWVAH